MTEDGEMWKAIRKRGQEKRARNRISSSEIIQKWAEENGGVIITFNDAHMRVNERFDFWPGTGKWLDRATGTYHRGVFDLIKTLKANMSNNEK